MRMTPEYWQEMMNGLNLPASPEMCSALIREHERGHRHYHTREHISACLEHLADIWDRAERPFELALAFWFHDAVYKPFSPGNERASADWAIEFLSECGAEEDTIDRAEELIMATIHGAGELSGDTAFMADIDLAILGARPEIYDQYETNIRREYKWVPGFIFRKKRKELLQSFLDMLRIYRTDFFAEKWEAAARENLIRAITEL